jgi:hypothetical protein
MNIDYKELQDAKYTGKMMHQLVNKYYLDMAPYSAMNPSDFFNLMKNLPYNPDPKGMELIKRPYFTMNKIGAGGDCDDKAICVGAWAKLNNISYKFVGVGRKINNIKKIPLSHVYTELYLNNEWVTFDTTYSYNIYGKPLTDFDRYEIL